MEFCSLLADQAVIAKMTDADFGTYWAGLGQAVRVAATVSTAPEGAARTEVANVAASTQVAWAPVTKRPVPAFGFRRAE